MPDSSVHDDLLQQIELAEQQLEQVRAELAQHERLATLGTLLASVAHELNNLLAPMASYAQLTQAYPDDQEIVAKAISKTLAGTEQATRIIRAILGFATNENADAPAVVRQTIEAAFDCVARDPGKDLISVEIDVASQLTVAMPGPLLQQVLLNLILNACTAMRQQGGGHLRIAARHAGDGGAVIMVEDTGPGIPESIVDTVFEPFVTSVRPSRDRVHTLDQEGGSGLGLAICRRLIEEAGGNVSVASTGPRGTAFRIELPLAMSSATARAGGQAA